MEPKKADMCFLGSHPPKALAKTPDVLSSSKVAASYAFKTCLFVPTLIGQAGACTHPAPHFQLALGTPFTSSGPPGRKNRSFSFAIRTWPEGYAEGRQGHRGSSGIKSNRGKK